MFIDFIIQKLWYKPLCPFGHFFWFVFFFCTQLLLYCCSLEKLLFEYTFALLAWFMGRYVFLRFYMQLVGWLLLLIALLCMVLLFGSYLLLFIDDNIFIGLYCLRKYLLHAFFIIKVQEFKTLWYDQYLSLNGIKFL